MKTWLTISALGLSSSPSWAQPSETDIALKAGVNAATLTDDNRDNRYGFSGGILGHIQLPFNDRISLGGQAELLYTPRGAEAVLDGVMLGQFREHYVDFMLAVRPEVRFGAMGIYLLAGGGLNVLISASKDDAAGAGQDITGGLHRLDVALLGGAGVVFHLPGSDSGSLHLGTVFLEVRHDVGLTNVFVDSDGVKNRTSSVMLGVSVALGGSPASGAGSTSQTADRFGERPASAR
jgi:Outer membrane protein beta-barrel domain